MQLLLMLLLKIDAVLFSDFFSKLFSKAAENVFTKLLAVLYL